MKKNIWQEIKEQPPHIRETFMWLCVVVSFSVIGYAWFRTTADQFVALVNPERARQETQLANANDKTSPFATINSSLKDFSASILELIDFTKKTNNFEIKNNSARGPLEQPIVPPQQLPLSGNKKK